MTHHERIMETPWKHDGVTMDPRRIHDGSTMDLPWTHHGVTMGAL